MATGKKEFATPDEVRTFAKGKIEIVKLDGTTVAKFTLEPGWRWSKHVKPIAGTEWCEAPHKTYIVSGRIHVLMKDGQEFEAGPGTVTELAPGHDGWVVGDEPVVMIDWSGASEFAQK